MTQTDIGFDTQKKLWYIESQTDNRQNLGAQLVLDANINLQNVIVDTYAWKHDRELTSSHGRVRFFDNDQCTINKKSAVADSIDIKGESSNFDFHNFGVGQDVILKFNLPTMDWTITIAGNDYITKNIAGNVNAKIRKDKLRFIIKRPKSVLYSQVITIINSNLEIKHGH